MCIAECSISTGGTWLFYSLLTDASFCRRIAHIDEMCTLASSFVMFLLYKPLYQKYKLSLHSIVVLYYTVILPVKQ